ncbi:MAG TPA: menaquinone biosynthesis protein [Candidatus Tumulicola sp.]
MSLRCGRMAYTNVAPLYSAFDCGAIEHPGSFVPGVPATLNAMLLGGELDLSPISAMFWAQHAEGFVLLPDVCIGARDDVVSVLLSSERPPALLDGATVYITDESASGYNLLRVLLERRYDVRPMYERTADVLARAQAGQPTLLIGDAAIDALETVPAESIYDLGHLWHDWTQTQSVFGVWAARREAFARHPAGVRACMLAMTEAYAWARAHRERVIEIAQAQRFREASCYESYYDKLYFNYNLAAQNGLAAFCRELHAIGAIDRVPSVVPENLDAVAL